MNNISIVGLGKLGLAFATCWLKRGFKVVGIDKNPEILRACANAISPTAEPQVEEILRKTQGNFTLASSLREVNEHSECPCPVTPEITFIIVSTPSTPAGGFDPTNVIRVCEEVGKTLHGEFPVVVIASTISPTTTDKFVIPTLEKVSKKKCGVDFGVCYVPEWVALGELVHGFLNPDFTVIGESDPRTGDIMEALYRRFLENEPKIMRTSIVNAEISKVCLNAYIATKIGFANVIASICENIPGADASVVTDVIGTDTRIGKKYFKGGMSYGGPCFPRDVRALGALADAAKSQEGILLADTVDENNGFREIKLKELILDQAHGRRVGIFGVAFKPNTNVTEASPSVNLIHRLLRAHTNIHLYDPLVTEVREEIFSFGGSSTVHVLPVSQDLKEIITRTDVLVFMNNCKEFKGVNPIWLENKIVIDCWGVINEVPDNCKYLKLGKYLGDE